MQEKFCREWILTRNGAKSAIKAGYSSKTAAEQASRMLTLPNIKERIAELDKNILESVNVSAIMIANELKKVAFASLSDTRKGWMQLVDFEKLPEEVKCAISEISYEEREGGTWVKIKMHDKLKALDSLSKMCGFQAPDKVDATIKGDMVHKVVFEDMGAKDENKGQ
jgi:phage terminase small subunit